MALRGGLAHLWFLVRRDDIFSRYRPASPFLPRSHTPLPGVRSPQVSAALFLTFGPTSLSMHVNRALSHVGLHSGGLASCNGRHLLPAQGLGPLITSFPVRLLRALQHCVRGIESNEYAAAAFIRDDHRPMGSKAADMPQ